MYKSKYGDVDYLPRLNVVFVTWKIFCRGDDYRDILRRALDIMAAHPGCNYVADTRNGFENEAADTDWVFDVFAPKAHEVGCRHVFFIIDRDNRLKDELEGQSAELRKYFSVHAIFDIGEIDAIMKGS